tara:strand:- start:85 stop:972 length:888 start_codon:yes stop_codon:yes gene_type:complete
MEYLNDYRILGLDIDATKLEIKAAYKKLVLKYHPDKNKECKNYDEFLKITESYKRLISENNSYINDEDSDSEYDEIDEEEELKFYIDIIKYLYTIIKERWMNNENKIVEKTDNIIINLDVELKDIYKHNLKKIKFKVLRNDNNKLILKKEDIYISLLNYKKQYIFKGKADDDLSKDNGDVIVNINIINNDGYYIKNNKDEKYNLYYELDVSLYEYLFGLNKTIKIFDIIDHVIELDSNTLYENGEYIFKNKGIMYYEDDNYKYGDFIIKFNIFNKYLNNEYKEDENFKDLIKKYF